MPSAPRSVASEDLALGEYARFIQLSSEGYVRFALTPAVDTREPVHAQAEQILRHARVNLCNETFLRMHGDPSAAAMLGRPLADLLAGTREEQLGFMVAFLMSGYRLDNLLLAEQGVQGRVFRTLNNLHGDVEEGRLTTLWAVKREVTDLVNAQEELQAARDRATRIIELASVLVVSLDREGRVIEFNRTAEHVTGYSRAEIERRSWFDIVAPRQHFPQVHEEFRRLLEGGEPSVFEMPLLTPSGDERFIVWQNNPIIEDGKPVGTISFGIDITFRQRMEEALRRLNEELENRVAERTADLEATNRELESFAYSVSHDLRAPLRGIDGFTQALVEDYGGQLDERALDYCRRVRRAAARMGQLIDDLLTLSRITRAEMNWVELDVSAQAEDILSLLHEREPERRVRYHVQRGMRARGDAGLVRILFENLLDNAWKYTNKVPEASIEVSARWEGGRLVFTVGDNGAGFDMKFADKLFAPFQRLHSAEQYTGTGIGLATVQRIVARHGGRVWAEAEVGKGARFEFILPSIR
jgi:PAS domain S-box-containing protein